MPWSITTLGSGEINRGNTGKVMVSINIREKREIARNIDDVIYRQRAI